MTASIEHSTTAIWACIRETRPHDTFVEIIEFLGTQHSVKSCFGAPVPTGSKLVKSPVAGALIARLYALRDTPISERWPGADWPRPDAFADAQVFIESLPEEPIPFPNVGLADDGEVNFLWDHDGNHVDLGFYGDGSFSYYAHGQDGHPFHDDDVPARIGLPDGLKRLLCR